MGSLLFKMLHTIKNKSLLALKCMEVLYEWMKYIDVLHVQLCRGNQQSVREFMDKQGHTLQYERPKESPLSVLL